MNIQKMKRYLSNKRSQAECHLTLDDLQYLLLEANITIDDVGRCRGEYHLARYNDRGPYAIGNCRFITHLENQREKTYRPSEETKRKMSLAHKGKKKTPEHNRNVSNSLRGRKLTDEHKRNISIAMRNRMSVDSH